MNSDYEPTRFKAFMKSFDVFARPDRDRMPTRPYVEWKHYVDAAKQQLLNSQTLVEDGNGKFKIATERVDAVFKQIGDYLEAVA